MVLRATDVTDARPTEAAAAAASATPPVAPQPQTVTETPVVPTTNRPAATGAVFEADEDGVIEHPDNTDGDAAAVHVAQALTSEAQAIAAESKAAPMSEERSLALAEERKATDALIEKKRQAITAGLVRRDIGIRVLKHAIPVEDLKAMSIGTFPRITVDSGGIVLDKVGELGKWMEFELVSWAPVTLVVSGEQNDPEANKMIRSSYDGIMLDDQTYTVQKYVEYLRDVKKYPKANAKGYTQMIVMLIATANNPKPIPSDERKLYEISLAPTSGSQWQKFMLESGIRAARGGQDVTMVRIEQVKKVNGANTYGVMTFDQAKTVDGKGNPLTGA